MPRVPSKVVSVLLVSLAIQACTVAFHLLNDSAGRAASPYWLGNMVATVTSALLGALLVVRLPKHRIGWLFLARGLSGAVGDFAGEYGTYAATELADGYHTGVAMQWLANWVWWIDTGLLEATFLLFPSGHLHSGRWRPVLWMIIGGLALVVIGDALMPGPLRLMPATNPLGIDGAESVLNIVRFGGALLQIVGTGAALGGLFWRLRRAVGLERQQLKWFASAGVVALVLLVGSIVADGIIGTRVMGPIGALLGASLLVPAAISVAILRYRLYAIDRLINRTLVYAALTAIVIGCYIGLVVGIGSLLRGVGNLTVSLVATGVVVVLVQPLRTRLQRAVNRVLYGHRDEPYAALSVLGRRLEATLLPGSVLPAIVETIVEALNVSYAAVVLADHPDDPPAAAAGSALEPITRVPLVYQYETLGELVLGARAIGESLTPTDLTLVEDLARQAGIAVHAERLTAELQRARERLVSAREEERRRLRRDLHDGLGPQLASMTMSIEAVRTLMQRDLGAADALLDDVRGHAQSATADIRRLVYALRPPALDDLGLVSALREQASHFESGLRVRIESNGDMSGLPAAVEVAAYRIVQEALTNVARHAHAQTCVVRLKRENDKHPPAGVLLLDIEDDGVGIRRDQHAGVGLGSMQQRATELGGTWTLEPAGEQGTRVQVCLPLTYGERIAPDGSVFPANGTSGDVRHG